MIIKRKIVGIVTIFVFLFSSSLQALATSNILMVTGRLYNNVAFVSAGNSSNIARYLSLATEEANYDLDDIDVSASTIDAISGNAGVGVMYTLNSNVSKLHARGRATIYNSASPHSGVADVQIYVLR